MPIHREAPAFVEQATEQQILVTGIKVSFLDGVYSYFIFLFLLNSELHLLVELGFIDVAMSHRLLTFLLHIKEEERLGFLVVLVWEKLYLSWNLSTMLQKLMVCFCCNDVKALV